MATSSSPVTDLLQRWSHGDKAALDSLMPSIYDDLRRLANFYLQDENNARTLQSTALVHGVYLRLCGQQDRESGFSRSHFLRMFRKSMGLTPHRYLLQLRVKKAKSMLKQTRQHLVNRGMKLGGFVNIFAAECYGHR